MKTDLAPCGHHLALFLTGELSYYDFKDWIDNRLFTLRQSPRLTKEKKALSRIQLAFHEADEGGDTFRVYMAAQGVVDTW